MDAGKALILFACTGHNKNLGGHNKNMYRSYEKFVQGITKIGVLIFLMEFNDLRARFWPLTIYNNKHKQKAPFSKRRCLMCGFEVFHSFSTFKMDCGGTAPTPPTCPYGYRGEIAW